MCQTQHTPTNLKQVIALKETAAGDSNLQNGKLAVRMHQRRTPTCVNAEVFERQLKVGDVWPPLLAGKHLSV